MFASWDVLGRLGAVLGRLGGVLDRSWGGLGRSWGGLGPFWPPTWRVRPGPARERKERSFERKRKQGKDEGDAWQRCLVKFPVVLATLGGGGQVSGRVWVSWRGCSIFCVFFRSWRGCSSVWACLGILARVLKCLGVLGAFWRGCSSVRFLF